MDKLEKIYIPHIKSQTRIANIILFTGAGFSAGATNILGGKPPLAKELKEIYWKICYGDDEIETNTNLAELYDACLIKNRKELTNVTRDQLSIKSGALEDWYKYYFEIPWISAYTINIDNIEKVASEQFNTSRQWTGISSTSQFTSALQITNPQQIQMVHLNGCLEDLPDKVTFSTTQYTKSQHTHNPWALRLSNDLLSHSIIFVGTNLDEPHLWHYLTLRGERGERGLGELRPRSYLITPTLSKPRISLLSQFNIIHVPMTAEEFAIEVLSKITQDDRQVGYRIIEQKHRSGNSSSNPQNINSIDLNTKTKTEFLMGAEPEWSDITSGRAVETEFDKLLYTKIRGFIYLTPTENRVRIVLYLRE